MEKVFLDGQAIEVVQRFCYLGDTIEAQGEASAGVTANPIFKPLHMLKFQDIKNLYLEISQFMFSISNNNLPTDFQDMFTLNNQIHSYNTRSSNFFPSAPYKN